MYDAHTHLNDEKLFPQRREYVQSFVKAGGKGLVNIGTDQLHNQRALEIARDALEEKLDCLVKAVIGIHPRESISKKLEKKDFGMVIDQLRIQYQDNRDTVVGIGECGVDLHYEGSQETLDDQKELFALQCGLARELDLPVVIHSRTAFDETLGVLKNFADLKIYFHCRGYSPEQMKQLIALVPKLWIGFCGNVTYPKAQELRDGAAVVPLTSILCETDAPYLAPQALRGQQNEPANV